MSAIISPCGTFRYYLEREVQESGLVYGYFGVNGSTADATRNDSTVKKWIGFTRRLGGSRFLVGNLFGFRATDVHALAQAADPVGPDNLLHVQAIISRADVLVPCWGSRDKVPKRLHHHIPELRELLFASGKPVKIFGLTQSGDPMHPLMLSYDTPLVDWLCPAPNCAELFA